VRQAVSLAIDRKAYVQAVRQGGAQVGGVMLPQPFGVWGLPAEELAKLPGYGDAERQKEEARSMLPGLNGSFLIAGRLVPSAFGTNGDVLGVFKEHTRL
jgi:peptide/nickel transport system substrate-binding protein